MQYQSLQPGHSRPTDYSQWSIEELWQLASQLRVAGARNKSRRELLDLFAVSPTVLKGSHRHARSHLDEEPL